MGLRQGKNNPAAIQPEIHPATPQGSYYPVGIGGEEMKMHYRRPDGICRRILDIAICGFWVAFNGNRRADITDDNSKVTCLTCRKMLKNIQPRKVRRK